MSSPQAPILQELLWDDSFPCGAVLQEQITPVWVPHGTTDPDRSLLLQRLSTTCSLPQGISTCSINGSPMAHRVDTCSTMVLHGLKGLSHHSFGRLVSLSYSQSSFPTAVAQHFLPFLKYVISEVEPLSLVGSPLARGRSLLDSAGTPAWKCPTWEQLLISSLRCHP